MAEELSAKPLQKLAEPQGHQRQAAKPGEGEEIGKFELAHIERTVPQFKRKVESRPARHLSAKG